MVHTRKIRVVDWRKIVYNKVKSGNTYKVESSSEGNKAGYIEKITIKTNGDDSGSGGTSGRETGGKV